MTIVFYSQTIQINGVFVNSESRFLTFDSFRAKELIKVIRRSACEQGLPIKPVTRKWYGNTYTGETYTVEFEDMKVFGKNNYMVSLKYEKL